MDARGCGEPRQGAAWRETGCFGTAVKVLLPPKATVTRLSSAKHSVAGTLRQHAVDISADMIVMGAYGHSRLRERIFGGVTRSMLDEPPLPILMAR